MNKYSFPAAVGAGLGVYAYSGNKTYAFAAAAGGGYVLGMGGTTSQSQKATGYSALGSGVGALVGKRYDHLFLGAVLGSVFGYMVGMKIKDNNH